MKDLFGHEVAELAPRRCFCGAPAKNAYRLAGTWEFFCSLDHVFDRCREVERERMRAKPDVPALKVYDALEGKHIELVRSHGAIGSQVRQRR